jgi:hypothetical protein
MNSVTKIGGSAPTRWTFSEPGPIAIGSEAHKRMFCRMVLDTFDPYKPAALDWPKLEPDALRRVTSLPFWKIAVETEDRARAHIAEQAKITTDPLMKEAIELVAFEENRHRSVLDALVASYGIELGKIEPYTPPKAIEWNFMSTGYGECLDSFFAFGLFALAERSGLFPPELVETFEPVIQEEARHITFFVNWAAYTQANTPLLGKPWFGIKRLLHLALNGIARMGVATGADDDFATHGKEAVGVDIELGPFIDLCLAEDARRMAHLDPRLLRPTFIPNMVRVARRFIPG